MLDEDSGMVIMRAEFLLAVLDYVLGVDHVRLLVAPVKRFDIVGVLFFIWPHEFVLVDLSPRVDVFESASQTVLFKGLQFLWKVLPILSVEHWRFNRNRMLRAHYSKI
jgi:hypothetical protein